MSTIGRKAQRLPIGKWEDFAFRHPTAANLTMGAIGGAMIALLLAKALFL